MVILESQLILKDECFYVNTREPTICFAFSRYVLLVLSWYLTFHYVVCSSLRYNYLGIKNTLFHVHTNFSFIFIFWERKDLCYLYGNWKRLVTLFLSCKKSRSGLYMESISIYLLDEWYSNKHWVKGLFWPPRNFFLVEKNQISVSIIHFY